MFNEQFRTNFKRLRQRSGLSQRAVAEALGNLSPQSVSKWERGEALPNIEYLPLLAEAFSCEIGEFFVSYPDENAREEQTVDRILGAFEIYEGTPEDERKKSKDCFCAIHLLAKFERIVFTTYGVGRSYFESFFQVKDERIDLLVGKMEKHEMLFRVDKDYMFQRVKFIIELVRLYSNNT